MPDAWLKGPVAGVPAALQPVAHALENLRIELEAALADATDAELWQQPAGAAPAGFHIRHLCGSVDRLFTYARDESLTETQLAVLGAEREPGATPPGAAALRHLLDETLARAMAQLRTTRESTLDEPRAVGRKRLPSTVRGLLFHAAEHGARHTGQVVTTMKMVRGTR